MGNYLDYLPFQDFVVQKALAQAEIEDVQIPVQTINPAENEDLNKLGLIAILVEDGLMDDFDMRGRIMTYANSAQKRTPHSKSFVLEVDKNESTFRIASMLEKLYFEGIDTDQIDGNPLNNNSKKEDNNQLLGVVLIGDVPIPVVHEDDGMTAPSIYPYTDFYRKAYIYNHETGQFEANADVSAPTPEVWHGLIVPPSKDPSTAKQELIAYFDKNYEFSTGNPIFADFEKRMLYANFPEMEKQMNYIDYSNYGRYIKYMEELVMNRFNKHLLKEMVKDVSTDLGSPDSPIMDDSTIDNMFDVHTENIFKKYAYNFAEALKIYRSGINESIERTGRWSPAEVDSPESLITMRDEYGKYQIKRKQLILEKETDEFIQNNVSFGARQENIFTKAKLKVEMSILGIEIDSNTFDFDGYFDGQKASDILVSPQCGIKVGQQRQEGQSVLENNSVMVNANRMYNPDTLLTPPDDDDEWELAESETYKKYAGCVFNNSMTIEETGSSPNKCQPTLAAGSIYDILGSIEAQAEDAVDLAGRCDIQKMTFRLPNILQYFSVAASGLVVPISLDTTLTEVIDEAYEDLHGNFPNADPITKGSFVVQRLIASGQELSYSPIPSVEIDISVTTEKKNIDTLYAHVEPTNETIKAIKHIGEPRMDPLTGQVKFPQLTTPSIPADGIRYISFAKNGLKQAFEYLNLFRVDGDNQEEITKNLLSQIAKKQQELNTKTTAQSNLFEDFFVDNAEIIEPVIWRAASIDQKLADIIPKYVDRDSVMPTPFYNPRKSPQNKPEGYEVLHIVADGDAQGYQFGLNRAMQAQAPSSASDESDGDGTGTGGPDADDDGGDGTGDGEGDGNYLCGDPAGVEIWEWFEALQCWIEEEILPAEELFKLDNSCSAAPLPPEEEEESEDIFDQILSTAATFDVQMKRKSLVPGQEELIKISALNEKGEPVLGYIDMPIKLVLDDPSLGTFSNKGKDVYIYTGEREIKFTAKKTGSSKLKITMDGLPENKKHREITINVYDSVDIGWGATEEIKAGRSEFTISVTLKKPDGSHITNINDTLAIGPEQPADGGFENGGQVKLLNGKGTIKFIPTPGKKTITLISKDKTPGITGEPFVIHPTGAAATQIILRAPPYIPIGKEVEMEVLAADNFGFPGEDFNGTISVQLDEKSAEFASLVSPYVVMIKGVGTAIIKGGKETADIKLIATHDDLRGAQVDIPLLARVDSADWEKTYPQNLFASFVGFPAGDFTQENYFGGTHLFGGKTEAVYSFLSAPTPETTVSIAPNHLITTTGQSQIVYVEFPNNELLLQAFDQKTMQTLISKKVALNFDAVEKYENTPPEIGKMYVDILDTDYVTLKNNNGLQIRNLYNEVIANLQPNGAYINDSNFTWEYESQPEYNVIELKLTNGLVTPARVLISLNPETIEPGDFGDINPGLKWNTTYGGTSTNDPTGLTFFAQNAEVPEVIRNEFYGLEDKQKYLSLFASGTNAGDAVKFNMPANAILLGDPTIKLKTKSTSSLNYNRATGQQIYEDAESKQIASINHFNFNNDGNQDIALLTEDGRVRLLEGGATEPPYKDKGNIAFLVDGGVALESFDFDKDNYEDLLVATDAGRLAILHNDKEVITRSDHKLNIGKKMYKILKGDMDQDGYGDLVILDSRGDIYIFYYDPAKGKFPENGKWIANYGYSLKLDANLNTDLDIRYTGMSEPSEPGQEPGNEVVPPGGKPPLEGYEIGGNVPDFLTLPFIQGQTDATKAAAENPVAAAQNSGGVPKLPWPEGDETETYFAPIESVGSLSVSKKVSNKDRPDSENVDLEETLTYTITINSGANLNNVIIADTVPDSLAFDKNSVTCLQGGCQSMEAKKNSIKAFFSGLNLSAGQTTIISYDVFVAHTPEADVLLQRINEPNENLPNPNSIIDEYLDILASPPYNNTGKLLLHYTTGPRSYATTESNDPEPPESSDALNDFGDLMNQMKAHSGGNFSKDFPPPEPKIGASYGDVLDEITGNNDCFEDVSNFGDDITSVGCAEEVLDDIGEAIADFSCMGGGCFPMPFNRAFLVPPDFAMPIFAFPTTLPTPIGPMPFFDVFHAITPIGAASIPGPIMSAIRLYLSPTLTGGIGIAMCWGPYPQAPAVPPPVWPIPYPPPVGNCMVTALPVDDLFAGACSTLRDEVFIPLMDLISSGINKVNSTVNDINNNPNIPGSIEQGGPDQGAGGLEISLAVNLGESMKFDPPAKAFSNTHIPTFDSIGGVISGWFDRQTMEIKNKLLTLPTFSIFLPDVKSLFTSDFQKTEKEFESWKNTMSGSMSETLNAIDKISQSKDESNTSSSKTVIQNIKSGMQDVSGSKVLQYVDAIETQASIYNLNALEGLYDVASTLPLVRLTEKPIQFDIPWLSAAEIQAWIMEAQNWVVYYEREYARVKDKWEALTCDDKPDVVDGGSLSENSAECVGRHLADAFGLNLDPLINSVKENIEVLQSYLAFPKQLVKFKQQLADYIRQVACHLDVVAQMMGGWMATIQQQMVSWAELILTIVAIIDNIEELFDLFTNFDANCDICTNERYANFGWWMLLGIVLPEIPIIQFPKIPDIVLDMSNMDALIDIELPVLNIRTKPIPLPPLPYITLPDLPSISILLTLPPLPILPRLPELPDLPPLPPIPTIDLPTLPVPPKLPDVAQAFEAIIPIIEKVLEIWCIMKKSFAPVPEQMLNDQITLLTNRPAYLIPLDLLKIQLPDIALFDIGFNELRIETIVYLGLRLNVASKPLEKLSEDWNGWIAEIPIAMNKAYSEYIEVIEKDFQALLDDVEEGMAKIADTISEGCIEYDWEADECVQTLQGAIDDSLGKKLEEADKWLRDKEGEWQAFADEIGSDLSYEEYYKAINSANETVNKWSGEAADKLKKWFAENADWIGWITPMAKIFEYIDEGTPADELQEILDLVAEKINESLVAGPTVLTRLSICLHAWPDCKNNKEAYFGDDKEASATINPELPKENKLIAQVPPIQSQPVTSPQISEEEYAKQILNTPQGHEIRSLLTKMTEAIDEVNENEMVDYKVLKEKFGVPDYKPLPRKTTVDKLRLMEQELIKHSDQLMAEAVGQKHITDLNAIAGKPPRSALPYELAEATLNPENNEIKVFTSALPPKALAKSDENPVSKAFMKLEERVERTVGQISGSEGEAPAGGLSGGCPAAVCLPDTITKKPVPVIPHIDLIGSSETLFMPNGHLAYSDGTGLYLKRDLTLVDDDKNTDTGNPKRYEFDEIASQLHISEQPMEAVNMLQTTFTENGASTFTWKPTAHSDIYGYGIELERTISGYDSNKQNNQLADTKIILLPADDEGETPAVTADDQPISFGTLVTSLTNKEEAAKKFGVSPRNIVTGVSEVRFPTVSNALINVSENKAVYFDQLTGSSYNMSMENGYYQIKMTWFDQYANIASYNQNEILAPQIYASSADPIDVSQTDTYYMPIFKDKEIRASEIFVDLAGDYNYYWFLNPETNTLTPEVGNTLNIAGQNEEKKFKVKLVATQNIEDNSFETFEKTFTVIVYIPTINLDPEQLGEGIIAGDMEPIQRAAGDDLSDIPFSVFRKRLGTWKNIGILRAEDTDKTATSPALDTEQHYFSVASDGSYNIEGFELLDPSPILLKDHEGNVVAEVEPDSGLINLNDPSFDIKAVPGGTEYPTHIAIIKRETEELLGNVYYIADTTNNVTIKDSSLTLSNVESSGVTVGDANASDDVVAAVIPVNGPSFPGGVAIFEDGAQENVALVDKDGTIRMMKAGYELRIKNKTSGDGKYIFQIVTSGGSPIYDIFIQANFDNLQVDNSTDMDSLNTQIGFLKPVDTAFAQSTPETSTEIDTTPVPGFQFEIEEPREVEGNPFPDVDESHPFFSQILELYKSRVISGYGDGSFKPDQKLTRAEFIKIALGVTNCVDCTTPNAAVKEKYTSNPFPDVSLPSWYFYCISIAKELGMITGYGDGFFRPERNISRAEAAAVLLRQSGIEIVEAPENAFVDVPEYAWYVDYVYTAVEIGLIQSNFGVVGPDVEITRGEFAFMAAGVKDLSECRIVDTDDDGVPDWWEMTHDMDIFTPDADRACPCYDSPWTLDTDGDGKKDVCDLDIDNDGVLNPLCIFTDTGEIDPKKLAEGVLTLGSPLDNCIFDPNEDQVDFDTNTIGNICEEEPILPIEPIELCECSDNPNMNDTDEDGIRDVCDDDIDSDGILNPICIFDESGLLDPSKLAVESAEGAEGVEIVEIDNCIFVANSDQVASACEATDLCPTIPEDIDGVDDEDGCPELNDNFPAKDPGVYVGPGELCGFVDFTTGFMAEDRFMTAITDLETHEILLSESTEVIFSK